MWLVFSIITATTGTYVETKSQSASYATVAFIYLYNAVHNLGWTGAMMVYGKVHTPFSYIHSENKLTSTTFHLHSG